MDDICQMMRDGDWSGALRVASKKNIGPQREAVSRAWSAIRNPDFYREIGDDPDAIVEAGIEALKIRFPIGEMR